MPLRGFLLVPILLGAWVCASAEQLTVRVFDPHGAAVGGARVALYKQESSTAVAVQATSAQGAAVFAQLTAGAYRVEVLAAAFAAYEGAVEIPRDAEHKAQLTVAGRAETVVVTASGTPLPAAESGAPVAILDRATLEVMQPTAEGEALRFLPGAVINTAGRRGGIASLFVRGGDSRYNKVLVDGVPVAEPGGTFDFGVVPLQEAERVEFVRGAVGTLYGSDAMTSVVEVFSAAGRTRTPELRFGADGGHFSTAHGYASLAGARGRLDFNLFADEFHTQGQGVNDEYGNSSQGGNIGVTLSPRVFFRLRARHSNNRSGVQGAWEFNGAPLASPDIDQFARQRNFLASAELAIAAPARWQHRLRGYEYNHKRLNQDDVADRGCDVAAFDFTDCFFSSFTNINRAGFSYQGEYAPRAWLRTTFGYEFEDENGALDSEFLTLDFGTFTPALGTSHTRGLRRNHALYAEQVFTRGRIAAVYGFRYAHNESFGNRVVPRVAVSVLALHGGQALSGTRLRFAYGEGIKAPRFEESFGFTGSFPTLPNPDLKAEENRSLEGGFEQGFAGGRFTLAATYFHNLFRNQINFVIDPVTFQSQYVNVNRAFAHGAEVEAHGRLRRDLTLDAAYVYTSTQVLEAPFGPDPAGSPLLRRPRHLGSLRLTYLARRWGGNLGGSFVGRRPDSDFFVAPTPITHAAGYARVDLGGWYAVHPRVTLYANLENLLDRQYNEVVGYPALGVNVRAGMRFRIGGE
ncbi:MAG TPA: TonB-dependent receptor [Terriglobales bacterium]|nr:TonB-dependent receptor [Terriglobales bacterium]